MLRHTKHNLSPIYPKGANNGLALVVLYESYRACEGPNRSKENKKVFILFLVIVERFALVKHVGLFKLYLNNSVLTHHMVMQRNSLEW